MNKYLERDWNLLIILDACRWDIFKQCWDEGKIPIRGKLEKFDSNAVNSPNWYWNNWDGQEFPDVQLLTANPKPFHDESRKGPNKGKHLGKNFGDAKDIRGWRAVTPHVIMGFYHKYNNPNMRTILHMMPPHLPYVGSKGKEFEKELLANEDYEGTTYQQVRSYGRRNGWEELRKYYTESLLTALKVIHQHLFLIDGKTVITSDHAELIGEMDDGLERYHHFPAKEKKNREILRTVPWLEVDEWDGKTKVGGMTDAKKDRELIEARLKKLGYM